MSSKKPKLDTIATGTSPKLATVQGTSAKETIYVDVDDEITAIIDKVTSAKGTIIALVLPKRAVVLQSIVNMKLLQRTAADAGKNIVLVTSETGLLPLAGLVGLHVAETPTSKPVIPPKPDQPSDEPEAVDEPIQISDGSGNAQDFDKNQAADVPIGQLAGVAGAAALTASGADDELVMDDDASEAPVEDVKPVKRNKKLSVPNFDKFRLKLVFGAVLVALLITGWIVATKVLPSAAVAIQTNSEVITSNLNLTLDTAATSVDAQNKIIPATAQSTQKTYTQQVAATGEKNNGEKATGTVYFALQDCQYNSVTIPTGSGVSANGKTYITQKAVTLNSATIGGHCNPSSLKPIWSGSADVVAIKGGAAYNLPSGTTFSVPSSISGASSVGATASSEITGGTDDIIKIVSQADIDSAKAKIAAQDTSQVKQDLQSGLKAKGLMAVPGTFVAGDQQVKASANPGDQAESVTVTSTVPYTMLGIKKSDLQQLVTANVDSQIDKDKQKILDDGITTAQFTVREATATSAVVGVKVQSVAGPDISVTALKKQIAGKKSGEITSSIGNLPGVTKVQVSYSPFWVSTAPTNVDKITVTVAKPTGTK